MSAHEAMGRQFRGPVAQPGSEHNVEGTYWHPGGFKVRAGELDDTATKAFSEGQCHALARAVHERTGWPIAVRYQAEASDTGLAQSAENHWDHAYVVHPSGKVLDVHGLQSKEELDRRLGDDWPAEHQQVPHDWPHWKSPGIRRPAMKVARSFVDPLLKKIGES